YDTALFQPIIRPAERIANVSYGKEWETDYAPRVLAAHARAMTILLGGGVIPGNGGRRHGRRSSPRRAHRQGRPPGPGPHELTEGRLREQGLELDRRGYETALEAERERARAGARSHEQREAGDSEFGDLRPTEFLAWTDTQSQARVLDLRTDGAQARLVL